MRIAACTYITPSGEKPDEKPSASDRWRFYYPVVHGVGVAAGPLWLRVQHKRVQQVAATADDGTRPTAGLACWGRRSPYNLWTVPALTMSDWP